jgi:hypothetical protein
MRIRAAQRSWFPCSRSWRVEEACADGYAIGELVDTDPPED